MKMMHLKVTYIQVQAFYNNHIVLIKGRASIYDLINNLCLRQKGKGTFKTEGKNVN